MTKTLPGKLSPNIRRPGDRGGLGDWATQLEPPRDALAGPIHQRVVHVLTGLIPRSSILDVLGDIIQAVAKGSELQWEFQDKYLERLCRKAWNKLPEFVKNRATAYIGKISDDGALPPQVEDATATSRELAIAKFSPGDRDVRLFRKACNVVSDDAIVGAFVHEVAHAFKTAVLTDQSNPYGLDAIEHAGDALPSGWSFSREISALILERAQTPGTSVFGEATQNLLGQSLISFATGLLFLKSFSDNRQFLVAGLLMVALSLGFLAAALGHVINRLRGLRASSLRYGTNLWFAFMVVGLARIVVAWAGAPDIAMSPWLSTFLRWAAPVWIYVFFMVFVAVAIGQVAGQLRHVGAKKGIPDLLTRVSWTLGTFAVFLLILTDGYIRLSIVMIGVAVVCLATNRLLLRRGA